MKTETPIEQYLPLLTKRLSAHRLSHTLGVAYMAAALAMAGGKDTQKAMTAGLLHDLTKEWNGEEQLVFCRTHNLFVSAVEERNPFLLHGKTAAWEAEHVLGISDREILNAIAWHTTGRAAMSDVEIFVFIADYLEPGRNHADNLSELRRLAFRDVIKCTAVIAGQILSYLESQGKEIDPMTAETRDYYERQEG